MPNMQTSACSDSILQHLAVDMHTFHLTACPAVPVAFAFAALVCIGGIRLTVKTFTRT